MVIQPITMSTGAVCKTCNPLTQAPYVPDAFTYFNSWFNLYQHVGLFFSKEHQSPTADHKEQKKREKQRLEREKKEQREREKKENEMKKKFKVSFTVLSDLLFWRQYLTLMRFHSVGDWGRRAHVPRQGDGGQ